MADVTFHPISTKALPRQRSTKAGAIRMARLKERRARGFWCTTLEICQADLDGLVRRGYLDRMARNDSAAVGRAIASVLERL